MFGAKPNGERKAHMNLENFIVWKFSQREEILKTKTKQSAKV